MRPSCAGAAGVPGLRHTTGSSRTGRVSEMGWFGQLHLEVDGIGHILASVIRFYSQKTNEHTKNLEASGERPMMMNPTLDFPSTG